MMKKTLAIIIAALVIIITGNVIYYVSLYNKQMDYIVKLLDRQVQIIGLSVDHTDEGFSSDLNQTIFSEDIALFFSNPEQRAKAVDRMKLFFSKYSDLVKGIRLYDNNKNEFTLKKDETGNSWLEQNFVLHAQGDILSREVLVSANKNFDYYLPVIRNNIPVGNIVVTVDYQQYFNEIFTAFNFQDYQWQWVLNDIGEVIYSNYKGTLRYSQIQKILEGISRGEADNITHRAEEAGKSRVIISSYYSTRLLQKNLGIVFSSPTDKIQSFIIRNSILMGLGTILIIMLMIMFFLRYARKQKGEIERLKSSEATLFRMIGEMPVGIIIYNNNREILRANRKAAEQYSFPDENEMAGKLYPEPSVSDEANYFSKNLGGSFTPDQFVILRNQTGDVILFRTSIPIKFMGDNACMDMLIDVTNLESARKQEASANTAKSEFLARMSYEIRTPLNGIIGMTDILERHDLAQESREILGLLRRSTEVLLNIINDILDFSKIESGKMIIDEIPFNLREEIVYCYDLARTIIDESQISLTCSVDDNVPDRVIGDPYRLRQVITNFLGHSIESTARGKINLKCELLERQENNLKIVFEVSDTGKNYDKATLKKLFGDFINIESKVHTNDDESGFGMILARQIVELMGGEFSVESPSGLYGDKGTRIRFTIMIYSNEKREKDLHFERIRNFGNIKTLVIAGSQARDEEILGTLHKLGLGFTVTTFQKLTINQIRANQNYPDNSYHLIVILDDKDFDGFKAAQEIYDNNLSGLFRIIMISSSDQKGNLLKCINMGVDHYIVKPYEIKELYDILRSCFPGADNTTVSGVGEPVRKDLRILIVEDNKMNQKVIGTMLKSLGYSFDFADDGFAGLIQAKTRRYDVIFMDLLMPEMDGFESARKILEYDNTLLIVAFTADNLPESKRKAELAGIKEFIPKPVRIDDLKKFFSKFFFKN